MNFKPLGSRVLIEREEQETKTAGGIIIPDTAKEKPVYGKVIAIGPGEVINGTLVAMSVKAGDKVLFGKWSGTELKIEGKDYLIMKEEEILGIA